MPQFAATIKHISEGVQSVTTSVAIKNIEGWEERLQTLGSPAAQSICADLGTLKEHLQASSLDGEAIRKLVTKLGKDTVALASSAGGDKASQVKALGEALTQAAAKA